MLTTFKLFTNGQRVISLFITFCSNTCSNDFLPGCTCSNGWSNDYGRTDCSCTTSVESCKHTRSEEICSNHGECQCGKCKCDKGYKGKYCQKEFDKDSVCQKLGPCINENVNG